MPSENAADAGFQTAFFMCRFSDGLLGSADFAFCAGDDKHCRQYRNLFRRPRPAPSRKMRQGRLKTSSGL